MHFLYVIRSQKFSRRIYIGTTSDLRKRKKDHNNGSNKSTKYGIPWELVYYEAYASEDDALERERKLKKYGSAYGKLKKRIARSLDKALKGRGE